VLGARLDSLRWSYRKTAPDLAALLLNRYPRFVRARVDEIRDEIPVFTFHSLHPETFEAQLRFLAENDYRTLGSEEFRRALAGETPIAPRSVVLTFDDGLASLFSVAQPLLAQYRLRGLAFIIPACIPEKAPHSVTVRDLAAGRATTEEVLAREAGPFPLCSWEELGEMHAAGSLEFHSHSLHHDLVPVSPRVVDFLNPAFSASFSNTKVPAGHDRGTPTFDRKLEWGTPVHRAEPRLAGFPQYFDDEEVRNTCRRYVAENGAEAFFTRRGWRSELGRVHGAALRGASGARYATAEETEAAIYHALRRSREWIRERLPGAAADHLCYPWYAGSDLAALASKRAGYRVNHWGILPRRPTNRAGDDPFRVSRVDERYLFRLPGRGQRALREILKQQLFQRSRHGVY
jgi:peptidoglycan/xylan/chitin deacetylase (PgdA/CDA1 family)